MEPERNEERIAELERQLRAARAVGQNGNDLNSFAAQPSSLHSSCETPLAAAPRTVPFQFLLAEALPFRWWYVFTLFLVAIPPIIVWMMKPALLLPAAVLVLVLIYAFHVRGALTRVALLKWGQVATVTGSELISQGTYYGGTTYSNVVLPVAHGWTVTRPLWSGPKSKTRIRYSLDGYQGELTVGGREYIDGVILADQRKPERALCVTSFPYDLDREDTGDWSGHLRVRLVIGMICWLVVMVGWVGGAAILYPNHESLLDTQSRAGSGTTAPIRTTLTPAPGTPVIINGANETRSIACDGNDVTVNGLAETVDIRGHCLSLTVSGNRNHVTVDVADAITANGINNLVTFRAGAPVITNDGVSNVVKPG